MKETTFLLICLLMFLSAANSFGQQSPNPVNDPSNPLPDWVYRNAEKRQEMERLSKKGETDFNVPNPGARLAAAERRRIMEEEAKRIKLLTAPNSEDSAKYREFLKQKNTGLFRLIPNFGCMTNIVVYAEGECAEYVPNGWVYSFRQNDYAPIDYLSDIRLDNDNLIADGFLTQGILVSLGDVSLEEISETTAGMKFIVDFKPAEQIQEAKKQYAGIANGVQSDNFKYSNSVKVQENTSYALRLAAYKSDREPKIERKSGKVKSKDNFRYLSLKADKRIDLTIAFRVVRKEENGGITILWKEISQRNAPKLIIPKKENLTDIK